MPEITKGPCEMTDEEYEAYVNDGAWEMLCAILDSIYGKDTLCTQSE